MKKMKNKVPFVMPLYQLLFIMSNEEYIINLLKNLADDGLAGGIIMEPLFNDMVNKKCYKVINKMVSCEYVTLTFMNNVLCKAINGPDRDYELINILICNQRVDINIDNNMLFKIACWDGKIELVKFLMKDKRLDVKKCDFSVEKIGLENASVTGNIEIAKLLLADSRFNKFKNDAAINAYRNNQIESVKLLLSYPDINPTFMDEFKDSILSIALKKDDTDIIKLLIPKLDMKYINNPKIVAIAEELKRSDIKVNTTNDPFVVDWSKKFKDFCNEQSQNESIPPSKTLKTESFLEFCNKQSKSESPLKTPKTESFSHIPFEFRSPNTEISREPTFSFPNIISERSPPITRSFSFEPKLVPKEPVTKTPVKKTPVKKTSVKETPAKTTCVYVALQTLMNEYNLKSVSIERGKECHLIFDS